MISSSAIATAETITPPPEQNCAISSNELVFDEVLRETIQQYQQINQLTCENRWEEATALMHQMVSERGENECPLCLFALPLGEAQAAKEEWRQAFDTYNYALSNTSILDGMEYDVFGYQLVAYDRIDDALAAFQSLATHLGHQEPSHQQAFAYVRLGDSLFTMGHWDTAQTAYETALQFNPNEPFAYEGLGLVWMGKEEWTQAIAAFEKTLELHPTLTEPAAYIQQIHQYLDQLNQ